MREPLTYHAVERQQGGFGGEGGTALGPSPSPVAGVAVGTQQAVVARGAAEAATKTCLVLGGVRGAPAVELELPNHSVEGRVRHDDTNISVSVKGCVCVCVCVCASG